MEKTYQYGVKDAPHGQYFYIRDGRVVKNIKELAEALQKMKPKVFKHHVNREKNDFSEWVRNSLKDENFANALARLVMKDKTEILILRKIIKESKPADESRA